MSKAKQRLQSAYVEGKQEGKLQKPYWNPYPAASLFNKCHTEFKKGFSESAIENIKSSQIALKWIFYGEKEDQVDICKLRRYTGLSHRQACALLPELKKLSQ